MKLTLIAECKLWWKLWSVRLAAVAGVVAAVISAAPGILEWLVNEFLPDGPWRVVTSVAVGLFVFVIPTIARLMPQKKLHKDTTDAP